MNIASPIKPEKKSIKQILADQEKPPMLKVQSTKEIKLKDSPGRNYIKFNLVELFGFVPEEIAIYKVKAKNNSIIISAVIPNRVLLLEEERAKLIAEKARKNKIK